MSDDVFASSQFNPYTEFQDKHGHSEIVSFRCLPAVVSECGRLKEASKDFKSGSDVYRAAMYEGLKVLQEKIDNPDYVPNLNVVRQIEAERAMEAQRQKQELVTSITRLYRDARVAEDRVEALKLIELTRDSTPSAWVKAKMVHLLVDET